MARPSHSHVVDAKKLRGILNVLGWGVGDLANATRLKKTQRYSLLSPRTPVPRASKKVLERLAKALTAGLRKKTGQPRVVHWRDLVAPEVGSEHLPVRPLTDQSARHKTGQLGYVTREMQWWLPLEKLLVCSFACAEFVFHKVQPELQLVATRKSCLLPSFPGPAAKEVWAALGGCRVASSQFSALGNGRLADEWAALGVSILTMDEKPGAKWRDELFGFTFGLVQFFEALSQVVVGLKSNTVEYWRAIAFASDCCHTSAQVARAFEFIDEFRELLSRHYWCCRRVDRPELIVARGLPRAANMYTKSGSRGRVVARNDEVRTLEPREDSHESFLWRLAPSESLRIAIRAIARVLPAFGLFADTPHAGVTGYQHWLNLTQAIDDMAAWIGGNGKIGDVFLKSRGAYSAAAFATAENYAADYHAADSAYAVSIGVSRLSEALHSLTKNAEVSEADRVRCLHFTCAAVHAASHAAVFLGIQEELREAIEVDLRTPSLAPSRAAPLWPRGAWPNWSDDGLKAQLAGYCKTNESLETFERWAKGCG